MDLRVDAYKQIIKIVPWCGNCNNWNNKEEKCDLYNAKPPAKIIHEGCERWSDDIPF